ncbi:NTF2-related export protein 1 isoform X2 [Harpegnathos saltator]|uniref:NTF2-related export protein 1 isoform X2 n=1 Tax=Harpegnathos saltator TaxID=610380 RepID=UPI000948F071|nr:NTF2-related export protein 1 isoform X2 [Harpegnathos saltator]
MEQNLKSKIDQACRTAEEFTKLYYENLDKRRYLLSRMYMDTANLIWNGNGVEGKENIQKFWTDLPTSVHNILTLDAQPITDFDGTFLPHLKFASQYSSISILVYTKLMSAFLFHYFFSNFW